MTPGQAAYEAYEAHYEELTGDPAASWEVERDDNRAAWEAAGQAARADLQASYDELSEQHAAVTAERDQARKFADSLVRITTAWTRGMYAARIDILRGDTKAAIECLSEGLDGYDGTQWNGTETGAEWWERTKAEEGL